MVSSRKNQSTDPPRLLLVEPDVDARRRLVAALGRSCCKEDATVVWGKGAGGLLACGCAADGAPPCCLLLEDPCDIAAVDLEAVDLVICAVGLPGGAGLAVPTTLQPERPVLLTGSRADAPLAVEAIRAGAMDFVLNDGDALRWLPLAVEKSLAHHRVRRENHRLHQELTRSLADLEVKNRELETVINQLEVKARTDELTGLANRRWLSIMLEGSWAEAVRRDLPLACLMIDLDAFKGLNDALGHQRGDEMLRLAGSVIRVNCREVDITARYGGDEFCVLMPHTEPSDAVMVAERILTAFAEACSTWSPKEPRVGMSIGVAHRHLSRPSNADELVSHADEALYVAKSAGKNRVIVRDTDGVVAPMTRALESLPERGRIRPVDASF